MAKYDKHHNQPKDTDCTSSAAAIPYNALSSILHFGRGNLFGSITIQFSEECITVDRLGSASSMILNGFLDELNINTIVYDDSDIVSEENRLLTLPEPGNQLEEARSAISFG